MKQEYVSMQNRIIIKNDRGKDVYLIVGQWGRVGDALSLYTMSGDMIAKAKQTFLSVFPKFDLYYEGEKIASVVKRLGFRDPYFIVSKLNWLISGNFKRKKVYDSTQYGIDYENGENVFVHLRFLFIACSG